MADLIPLDEALLAQDPGVFRATVRAFQTTGMTLECLEGQLRIQGVGAGVRLEVRIHWMSPKNPQDLTRLLHRAAGSDLARAVPDACQRHGLNPLSIVALETSGPLAMGRSLGLPDHLIRSMPSKRKAQSGVGLWAPPPGSIRTGAFRNMALRRLSLVDHPDLEALPEGLSVAEAITFDRLPRLKHLSGILDRFHGILRIRCASLLSDMPKKLALRLLVIEGQPWVTLPFEHVSAPRMELRHMPNLLRLGGRMELQRLEVGHCPVLEHVGPLDGLVNSPEAELKAMRDGRSLQGHAVHLHHCSRLMSLSEGLQVPGVLCIQDCPSLQILPYGLDVRGLDLSRLPALRQLPENLHIRGNLVIDELGSLASLPVGLQVDGNLVFRGIPPVLDPPSDLIVGGCVQMHPAWVTHAWKRFQVSHRAFGTLR